jgi:hypothetical protein
MDVVAVIPDLEVTAPPGPFNFLPATVDIYVEL